MEFPGQKVAVLPSSCTAVRAPLLTVDKYCHRTVSPAEHTDKVNGLLEAHSRGAKWALVKGGCYVSTFLLSFFPSVHSVMNVAVSRVKKKPTDPCVSILVCNCPESSTLQTPATAAAT